MPVGDLPIVVEILPRPNVILNACRVNIGQSMLSIIPSAKAKVKPTNKRKLVINDKEFLMMSPVKGHIPHVLKNIMIWMTQDPDITSTRTSLWA